MLETISIVLIVLWALGFFGHLVTGSVIHVLLVIALILICIRLYNGQRIV